MKIINSAPIIPANSTTSPANSTTSPKQAQKPAQKTVEEPVSGVQINFKYHNYEVIKVQQVEKLDPLIVAQQGAMQVSRFIHSERKKLGLTDEKD